MTIDKYINELGEFLAVRDINKLSKDELLNNHKIDKVDVLILLGNAIPYTIKVAVEAYKLGLCKKLMICGGIGHSTDLLRSAVRNNKGYADIEVENKSEADIIKEIIVKYFNIKEDEIIVENKSTNCGDNALKAIELLDKIPIKYKSLLLIQDPTMQLRSWACFYKYLKGRDVKIINYAPFIPEVNKDLMLVNTEVDGIWKFERFLDLISGEIPRLRDDKNGYGPKGKNFISHVDVPERIEECYREVINMYKVNREI